MGHSNPPHVTHVLSPPGSFSKGVADGEVDPSFGPLEAIRLSIQTDSPVWIILSEVSRALVWLISSEVSQALSAERWPCPWLPATSTSFSLIATLSPFRFLSKRQSDTGVRKGDTRVGPLPPLPLPPPRGARAQGQPCPGHTRTGLGKGATGPGRRLLQKKSKKQHPCRGLDLLPRPLMGAWPLGPHRHRTVWGQDEL